MTSSSPAPENPRPTGALKRFLDERLGLEAVRSALAHKQIPQHRHTFWYVWGGMVLFLFLLQVTTGILLLLYYRPGPTDAYESVQYIVTKVPWGWLIRALHSIGANLLMFSLLVHMSSALLLRAYRRPRELTWVTGCLLFFVFLGFGFSGYLLPWNQLAFFATSVGTEVPRATPFVGDLVVRLMRGGPDVTGATLSRFFGLHVAILPALVTLLLGAHLWLVQKHGMSVPRGVKEKGPPMPFMPNFLVRDAIGWFVALGVLVTLIVLGPTAPRGALFPFDFLFDPRHLLELGPKADPFASAPAGIKPEWYFLFMFQTLKMLPATVMGFNGEMLGVLGFGLGGAALVLVPFLDRRASGLRPNLFSRVAGGAIVLAGLGLAALGTWSMAQLQLPLGVAGGVLAGAWILVSVVLDRRRSADAPSLLIPSLAILALLFIAAMTAVGRLT